MTVRTARERPCSSPSRRNAGGPATGPVSRSYGYRLVGVERRRPREERPLRLRPADPERFGASEGAG
ncbi:hypothetical protein, partial [Streptomyces sp. RP5T]|uniref:hypothetical protein n=1 Tax=Streptomyces sp. RP5T TaxID=2490848 RepID=UPI001C8C26CD